MKSKKGFGFFVLFVVSNILISSLLLTYQNSEFEASTNFGNTLKQIDSIQSEKQSLSYFAQKQIDFSLNEFKSSFIDSQILLRKQDDENPVDCQINSKILWFDESQEKKSIVVEEKEGKQILEKRDVCLPVFEKGIWNDFSFKFENNLESKLDSTVKKVYSIESFEVDSSFDDELGFLKTKSIFYYEFQDNIQTVRSPVVVESQVNVGNYFRLLESLEKNLPSLSEKLKNTVPNCLKEDSSLGREGCIYKEASSYFQTFLPKDFEEKIVLSDGAKDGFYLLNFEIVEKNLNKKILDFSVQLKDTIPFNLVDFELSIKKGMDNTLKISMFKPTDISTQKLHGFIVLYGYENFFDKTSYGEQNYNALVDLLKKGEIPKNFERFEGIGIGPYQHYYSKQEDNLNLNLLFVPYKESEKESVSNKQAVTVDLFQLYDFSSKSFELLQNKDVYAFVFAVGKPEAETGVYNYYINEELFTKQVKSIVPEKQLGVSPLSSQVTFETPNNLEKSLVFSIGNYIDSSFDHFELYLFTEDTSQISKACQESQNCFYYLGSNLNKNNFSVIVSSLSTQELTSFAQSHTLIPTSSFVSASGAKLDLQDSKSYTLAIVPVDKEGNGLFTRLERFNKYVRQETFGISHYSLEKIEGRNEKVLEPFKKIVTVKDTRAPDPLNSITLDSKVNSNNAGNWILNWAPKQGSDVVKLFINYEEYDSTNQIITDKKNVPVLSQSFPFTKTGERVEITRIIPVDEAGNNQATAQNTLTLTS